MIRNSGSINYSRAGDKFHYRWAAKRCLKLLDFNTELQYLTIEGSNENDKDGENVIDIAEYYETKQKEQHINYIQLKHTTKQLGKPFTLGKLKTTIEGFSKRYLAFTLSKHNFQKINFTIITNRPISADFKENIEKISKNENVPALFLKTLKNYTKLNGIQLVEFCRALVLSDGEGNYDSQKNEIHRELAQLTCSKNINELTDLLVAKISEKIEPDKNNKITINDVLEVFCVTDISDFFPAPPHFEEIHDYIQREQQQEIIESIKNTKEHTFITANGGVGKSILCNNIVNYFNNDSFALAYDCYGNGSYRRPSEKRHITSKAFVQIANQLAKEGFCKQLIPTRNEPDEYWVRIFISKIQEAAEKIKNKNPDALLVIIFDAVDNAAMQATNDNDNCFATLLIREKVPDNCRLVFSSRPERMYLLDPPSTINHIELKGFSDNETFKCLLVHYPDVNEYTAKEFNRLTSNNPRVQANALSLKFNTLSDLLIYFGDRKKTVEDLIDEQLEKAISKIKDELQQEYREQVDKICTGLATLPPFVPLEVLAAVSEVCIDTIRSFIIELGRPLWMIDDYVQFRDEPTEKWFQDKFIANPGKIEEYLKQMKPLSKRFSYIAETMPYLMLKAELFDELVSLALSDELLPENKPFDERKIRLFRLQYAFKAALKKERYFEAAKLALRTGEEIAGEERQIQILKNNCDLACTFLSSQRIQELAHKRFIKGEWEGSEMVYSASMLSSKTEYIDEARSYLRSAEHWLKHYFIERDKAHKEDFRYHDNITKQDILELLTSKYHLFGELEAVKFITGWRPISFVFEVVSEFINRLIDYGKFDSIYKMAKFAKKNITLILAITNELLKVGKYLPKQYLVYSLDKLVIKSQKTPASDEDIKSNYSSNVFLSFLEVCMLNKMSEKKINRVLNYYINLPNLHSVADEYHYYSTYRSIFLRYISIQFALNKTYTVSLDDIIPKEWKQKDSSEYDSGRLKNATEILGQLLPWYLVEVKILSGKVINLIEEHNKAKKQAEEYTKNYYSRYDLISNEINLQRFKNIILCKSNNSEEALRYLSEFENNKIKLSIADRINIIRVCCHLDHFKNFIEPFLKTCNQIFSVYNCAEDTPDSRAEQFISLSRAIFFYNQVDSEYYFNKAIEIASNFGNEAVPRWESIVTIAKKSAEEYQSTPETAYRFMRCAELIGETTQEKHWDRDDTLETCFMLSPETAYVVTSRWKERFIGIPDRQIVTLANYTLDNNALPSSALWCLSAFTWDYGLVEFCEKCLSKEIDDSKRQIMLDDLIIDFRRRDVRGEIWNEIDQIAQKYKLSHPELRNIDILSQSEEKHNELNPAIYEKEINESCSKIFESLYIYTKSGLKETFEKFHDLKDRHYSENFWTYCFNKLDGKNAASFLTVLSEVDFLSFYDIRSAFDFFPKSLKEKPSTEKYWNEAIHLIAQRFPERFTYFSEKYNNQDSFLLNRSSIDYINRGVIKGFSESKESISANELFNFVNFCTSLISSEEAKNLLDFGLERFELLIDDNFADGKWNSNLLPPSNINDAFVSFIYVNLGSPQSEERWKAIHAVLRLYKLKCKEQIEKLVELMISEDISSFIPPNFPFYNMHAKLYLLTALLRCSFDDVTLLLGKKDIFAEIALKSDKHLLIQSYARDIAQQIEKYSERSYNEETIEKLNQVGKSPFDSIETKKIYFDFLQEKSEQEEKTTCNLKELYFGYDIEKYWFVQLGHIFEVSLKQIKELAIDIILNEWKLTFESDFINDPRKDIWNNYSLGRDIHHSHGTYPKTDDYEFYLSYHVMFAVASKLIQQIPIIKHPYSDEDSLSSWIKDHQLVRTNNHFSYEYRDVFPVKRREWVSTHPRENWRWEISSDDFIELLFSEWENALWLNLEGYWNEYKDGYNENISISSVLVPEHLSNSLLLTVTHFDNYLHKTYLNNFCKNDYDNEMGEIGFRAWDWLYSKEYISERDSQDPFAGEIDTKPYVFDNEIVKKFDLICDKLQKKWYVINSNNPVMINEIWSDDKPNYGDSHIRTGKKAKASIEFLKYICSKLNVELVIQISIERNNVSYNKNRSKSDYDNIPGYSKSFLFSGDGKLRDTKKSYRIGKKNSKHITT